MPPLDAEAMAKLREMPEPHAARVRGRGHLATEIWRRRSARAAHLSTSF